MAAGGAAADAEAAGAIDGPNVQSDPVVDPPHAATTAIRAGWSVRGRLGTRAASSGQRLRCQDFPSVCVDGA